MPWPNSIAILGPDPDQLCGILDYAQGLVRAFEAISFPVRYLTYRQAMDEVPKPGEAWLLHQERSLLDLATLRAVAKQAKLAENSLGKNVLYVVPHEVYAEEPEVFPYHRLKQKPQWMLPLRQWLWRKRHPEIVEERAAQSQGYFAQSVIPLNQPAADILHERVIGKKLYAVVPHALPWPHSRSGDAGEIFSKAELDKGSLPRIPNKNPLVFRLGIFGYLNPSHDYDQVLRLVSQHKDLELWLLGGERQRGELEKRIWQKAAELKVGGRVHVTGRIPSQDLSLWFEFPDLFLFPARYKSSTGSLMHVFRAGKSALVRDTPLMHYLKDTGAPILNWKTEEELALQVNLARKSELNFPKNDYNWEFDKVARAYLAVILQNQPN